MIYRKYLPYIHILLDNSFQRFHILKLLKKWLNSVLSKNIRKNNLKFIKYSTTFAIETDKSLGK